MFLKKNRIISITIVLLIAAVSLAASFFTYYFLNKVFDENELTYYLLMIFISLLVGIVVSWLIGLILKNTTITKPLNSIYMIALTINFAWRFAGFKDYSIFMIVVIGIWAIEKIIKWGCTFNNLESVDARLINIKIRHPKTYLLIDFFLLNLVPMIVNFTLMLCPLAYMVPSTGFNLSSIIAIVLAVAALGVKIIAHIQLLKNKKKGMVKIGLWNRSRHPDYLAELIFWFAVYLITISIRPEMWGIFLGPILNCLLYGFIIIPLTEKVLLKTYQNYENYQKTTNNLLIFPKKVVEEVKK